MKPLKECKVLVTPTSYGSQDPALKPFLEEQVGEVVYNPTGKPLSGGELIDLLVGVDGYIAGLDQITAEVLDAARELKVVHVMGWDTTMWTWMPPGPTRSSSPIHQGRMPNLWRNWQSG